jgi:hypothetical protein
VIDADSWWPESSCVSAVGSDGPEADLTAFDLVAQAVSRFTQRARALQAWNEALLDGCHTGPSGNAYSASDPGCISML